MNRSRSQSTNNPGEKGSQKKPFRGRLRSIKKWDETVGKRGKTLREIEAENSLTGFTLYEPPTAAG